MKSFRNFILVLALWVPARAWADNLWPSNPPPVVQLTWDLVAGMKYNVYYGVGSGAYTNRVSVGMTNYATVTLPARGQTYYFAVTAVASGLESDFSNEVSFTPASPPSAPKNLRPPVVLSVQWKPDAVGGEWADAGMNWSLVPEAASALFRLQISAVKD
jgi:hypothetical protein